MSEKPDFKAVVKYATPLVHMFINQKCPDLPEEHREEVMQEAYLRLVKAYAKLDPDKGWSSFVYNHCRGAVLDYLKAGNGHYETKWSLRAEEDSESKSRFKIHERITPISETGDELEVEDIAGLNGIFSELNFNDLQIKWNLVSRMSAADESMFAFAKSLRGYKTIEIAENLGVSQPKVCQLINDFIARFDDPELAEEKWFLETIYAFGLGGHLGMPKVDHSVVVKFSGWSYPSLDLDSSKKVKIEKTRQLSFNFEEAV